MQSARGLLLQFDASTELMRRQLVAAAAQTDQWAENTQRRAAQAEQALRRSGDGATAAAKSLGFLENAAKGALAALTVDQFIAMGRGLVATNAEFQTLDARLRVATGSASAAALKFKELEQFAKDTPFTLDQVVDGYIKLKNLGLDPTTGALRDYGNFAASAGKDVMQFIEAVADASTGEFERLKEFGIKASKDGETIRFTFAGITTEVKNNSEAIQAYLRGIAQEKFGDAMALQADTINGKLSNLTDTFEAIQRTIGAMGFNDWFMRQLDNVTRQLSGIDNLLKKEGVRAALFGRSVAEAEEASTPAGYLNLLTRDANKARADYIRLQQQNESRGWFPMSPQVLQNAKRQMETAERRLRDYMFGDYLTDLFPANERGSFGALPKPPAPAGGSGGGGGGNKGKGKAKPRELTIGERARRGDFDVPVQSWAIPGGRGEIAQIPMNLEAMYASLKEMSQITPIKVVDEETLSMIGGAVDDVSAGLAGWLVYGGKLGDVLENAGKRFLAQMLDRTLLNVLDGIIGSVFGGGVLGGLFGGRRSSGGPVEPGVPYLVGENSPEIFIPTTKGRIAPNPKMAGAGGMSGRLEVEVMPSDLFDVRTRLVAEQTAAATTGAVISQASRPVAPASRA